MSQQSYNCYWLCSRRKMNSQTDGHGTQWASLSSTTKYLLFSITVFICPSVPMTRSHELRSITIKERAENISLCSMSITRSYYVLCIERWVEKTNKAFVLTCLSVSIWVTGTGRSIYQASVYSRPFNLARRFNLIQLLFWISKSLPSVVRPWIHMHM